MNRGSFHYSSSMFIHLYILLHSSTHMGPITFFFLCNACPFACFDVGPWATPHARPTLRLDQGSTAGSGPHIHKSNFQNELVIFFDLPSFMHINVIYMYRHSLSQALNQIILNYKMYPVRMNSIYARHIISEISHILCHITRCDLTYNLLP